MQEIAQITLVVRDYDEAITYYTSVLGFELIENSVGVDGKRWVIVAPPGANQTRLLLAKAVTPEQFARVGNQTGGRVFLFLLTDDFWRDFRLLKSRGVTFCEIPRDERYGTVAVFEDLYGNRWDLVQPSRRPPAG